MKKEHENSTKSFRLIVLDKVLEIERELSRWNQNSVGLYGGIVGQALFYSELHRLTKVRKYKKKCQLIVMKVIEEMSCQENLSHTFSVGFTGIAWAITFLLKCKTLRMNSEELFKDIGEHIINSAMFDLERGHYDFMHGGSGAVLYALNRPNNKPALEFLKQYVNQIERIKEVDANGYKWIDIMTSNYDPQNMVKHGLGLSHGIPSITTILTNIYKRGIEVDKTKDLVVNSLRWIKATAVQDDSRTSIFPSILYDNIADDKESRLAWCYGDLGIAFTFLHSGKIFNNKEWIQFGIDIGLKSLRRKESKLTSIADAGLCHGTSGVAHVYHKLYVHSNIQSFSEAHQYWIEQTIDFANKENGLAGYQSYVTLPNERDPRWQNDYGLLEGVSGIGLALMAYLGCTDEWDECLLLNS